ncbi:phosphotransferase [Microlunatus endophyticus]|uniref:Phosphotransferase n=1 Tax=Microlunatus endophyticus TaxID=1716077 RepID=A0A917S580_9ACTN|nr:aminoglycoside phosphotransferase family protein [Microlunatus endophyticus]GGL58920.1 phosphotransferase [Microlunatus endophyticus]
MDQRAIDWARGIVPDASITPVRDRPWSEIAEVRAGGRLWWLKINKAETVYETPLLGLLARVRHPLLPEAIAHDRHPWLLIADAGQRLDHVDLTAEERFAIWGRLLPAYAELQQTTEIDQLLAVGVPDFRPPTVPGWYDRLIAMFDADPAARAHLSADELRTLRTIGPWVEELSAELAAGVPPTLQHDDLHEGNVLATDDHRRLTVIDWGDSVVGHPFSTLTVTLGRLQRQLDLPPDEPGLVRLRDGYLEAWQGDGVTRRQLLRQAEVAYQLGALNRVYANYRGMGRLEPALSPDQPADGLFWVQQLIRTS